MSSKITDTHRICKVCLVYKPIEEFKVGISRIRLGRTCHACVAAIDRKKRAERRGLVKVTTKVCKRCLEEKSAKEFSPSPLGKDGLLNKCKTCRRIQTRELARKRRKDPLNYMVELKRSREYKKNNPEKMRAYQRKWSEKHPGYFRSRMYRLKKGDFTKRGWDILIEYYGEKCAYCGKDAEVLEIEHIIPLSKGGENTFSNVVPSCVQCNRKKRARRPEEVEMCLKKPHPATNWTLYIDTWVFTDPKVVDEVKKWTDD